MSDMKETVSKSKRPLRNDVLLIASLLLIAAVGLVYLFVFRTAGSAVTVTVDGELYGTYSLLQDTVQDIYTGDGGEGHNRLVIREGKAYVETATCPDGICVAHAPVFRSGESIVCLPNRVVITVTADGGTENPDIIV